MLVEGTASGVVLVKPRLNPQPATAVTPRVCHAAATASVADADALRLGAKLNAVRLALRYTNLHKFLVDEEATGASVAGDEQRTSYYTRTWAASTDVARHRPCAPSSSTGCGAARGRMRRSAAFFQLSAHVPSSGGRTWDWRGKTDQGWDPRGFVSEPASGTAHRGPDTFTGIGNANRTVSQFYGGATPTIDDGGACPGISTTWSNVPANYMYAQSASSFDGVTTARNFDAWIPCNTAPTGCIESGTALISKVLHHQSSRCN